MAFGDPITITVNGVAKTLNRIDVGDLSSTYASTDGAWSLSIAHVFTNRGRVRTTVEFIETRLIDPLTGKTDSFMIRHLFDYPKTLAAPYWTSTELDYDRAALAAFENTTNFTKLIGKES